MTKIITVTDKNKITISAGQRGPQGIQGPAGSGAALTIQDEGVNLATDATTLNFVGAGISAVGTGATKTITVTGLGGGGSFSGDYNDLVNTPTFATIATSGDYTDLSNLPSLFDGNYNSLTNKPTLFSGSYNDLTNKPTLFSESYNDLTNKPTLSTVAGTGAYSDLSGTPSLATVATSGDYNDLTNKPSTGSTLTIADEGSDLTTDATKLDFVGAGVAVTGTGTTKTVTITGGGAGSFSGSYVDLTNKPTLGTAAATAITDYATSAQGTKADTAVQPADISTFTDDQTGAEIKVAYEAEANTNAFTDTNVTTLSTALQAADITGLTDDQTGAEIKTAYEAEADTNAFNDAAVTKLAGIETAADVTDTTNVVAALTAGSNITISAGGEIASTGGSGGSAMTDSEVKTAYENNLDTNAFTDSDNLKLSNIEATAEVNAVQVTAGEITAATETATRSVSPADVKSFIDTHATGSDMSIARYIDNVGGSNLAATTAVTHTNISTAIVEDTSIYSNSNGVVTIAEAGNYMIKAAVGYGGANYRAILNAKIIKNGTVTLSNMIGGYLRGQGWADNSYVDLACVCTLAAGDTVELTTLLNQGNTDTCTAISGLCTLEFIKLSGGGSSGGSGASLPAQVSLAERNAGTETALRSYSPEDVKLMAIEHSPMTITDEFVALTSTSTSTTTTTGTNVNIGAQDMTTSAWDYHTNDGSMIGDNDWTLATRTTTSSTDSDGFAMYNIADTSTSTSGQLGWQHAGILLTSTECPDNTSITLTTEVLKTSLTKPVQFMAFDLDIGFQYQGWVELQSSGNIINQTPGTATQITGTPTVVDKTTTWEVTFTVARGTANMFVHVMPALRNTDGGAYAKNVTGDCTVSPFRIKGSAPVTTTTTTTVNERVQEKHITPTQTTMVDGATLGTVSSNDVAFCIVMGQSNAAGTNGSSPSTASISNVYTMTAGNYNFSSYVNNNSNVFKSAGSGNSNPLTEITREWQVRKDANPLTTPDLYIINIAKGGTGFAWDINNNSNWDPFRRKNNAVFYDMPVAGTVTDNASLFYTAQKAIREALSQFAKEGKRAFHIGTVWNQWENDVGSTGAVDRYPANLTLIRKMVDEELGIQDADFYPWRPIANFNSYATHGAQMKRTFDNFAANQNNVYLINTETFSNYTGVSPNFGVFLGDNLHYSTATQAFAAKFVLDNGYFAVDGAGNSIRRAKEVTMKVSDLQGISQMQPDGQVTTVGISDTQTTTAVDLNSV